MTALNKTALKALFQTGDTLAEGSFVDLIDSLLDLAEPGKQTVTGPIEFTGTVSAVAISLASAMPVASGGTGQTSYTNGQLLIGNTSGNTLTKATLTAGANVTITNGNGSITIASSGGGGGSGAWTLLSTQSASSSATIDFDSSVITASYTLYVIELSDVKPASDGVRLYGRVSQSGVFLTSNSDYKRLGDEIEQNTGLSTISSSGSDPFIRISGFTGNDTGENLGGTVQFINPSASGTYKMIQANVDSIDNTGNLVISNASGTVRVNTNACDGIRFYFDSGNIASGTFKLYGVS